MKEEIWKAVEGYEDYYEVSNFGNVRSVDRVTNYTNGEKHLWKGRILKPAKCGNGYFFCVLWKNGQKKTVLIHRLVAEAFIHNQNNLPQVNHKDENKENNHVENLEWCTQAYNNCYGTRLKRQVKKRSMPVLQIDLETKQIIAEYPSANEAARQLNIYQGNISDCCRGKRKTYKGFKWSYK